MFIVAPTGTYDVITEVLLTNVRTNEITTGCLITDNKITISNCIKIQGGGAELKEFWFLQRDDSSSSNLEKQAFDLYIFDNPDALGLLVSGGLFTLDANTTIENILFQKSFSSDDWIDIDDNNCCIHVVDLNTVCKTSEENSTDLYFVLVARGSFTFDDHTLLCRFITRQIKVKE